MALWLQAGLALLLLATGSGLQALIEYTSAAMLLSGSLTVVAVVVLRRKWPTRDRPYRAWLYPWSALFYVVCSAGVFTVALFEASTGRLSAALCLLWFAAAFGVYRLRRRREAGGGT